ncbi:hypothetical protein IMG5_064880 [Ichthyophthirius multifiliis]|uniref:VOC domain-containing protein n=1 Tax=Ichthyophthirius multifiliis TaxID=5932 RepID=G0QP76_ICHMU|nr:hypothetical protein IMG5_064880 [Ichthyophthirius multifiliis]EGR32980.1 hypothetical protein IMG5_064880 [Ichthyophthirius multifiliis]|eukprot:XP_004036966.1 hypothetical protein IMG5_064880 [Ichthyophthirius multifiliis]
MFLTFSDLLAPFKVIQSKNKLSAQEQEQLEKQKSITEGEKQVKKLANIERGVILGEYGNQWTKLHWDMNIDRRGLGRNISHSNHIALVVSDIGASTYFYSDILGLQQIERPNFDRHGAWFTMGNIELHLIKGMPCVPFGDDLLVGHIALEVYDADVVLERLKKFQPMIDFQMNVSVPTAHEKSVVKQFFLRDPDGYYVEISNTQVLTEFCFGSCLNKNRIKKGYEEAVMKNQNFRRCNLVRK